eukprot:360056-Chlamydomonas_euryale.AAC.6
MSRSYLPWVWAKIPNDSPSRAQNPRTPPTALGPLGEPAARATRGALFLSPFPTSPSQLRRSPARSLFGGCNPAATCLG